MNHSVEKFWTCKRGSVEMLFTVQTEKDFKYRKTKLPQELIRSESTLKTIWSSFLGTQVNA